ncbi:DUF2237 family protein [Larkinella rosea]|uniref:DUF2237 domain-containing protein n=1 Tax=Larkinella rosea TaxID=2025312 RepID=A0A3P1B9H9_9BACT|nr:DUF2237 domain-containing protein [Larkinella rosea]RRA97654.1 DUF2237 domain-containing protein [Larkinella rosea]
MAELNVYGNPLESCCTNPMTGFFRDGFCRTDDENQGQHLVCAIITQQFLAFSRSRGNDLITPRPELRFRGLKPGNRWCLHVLRWREAYEAGVAPPVLLASTHQQVLNYVTIDMLRELAFEE